MLFEDALVHYGIPGMRWGVRRDVGSDGRVRNNKVAQAKARKAEVKAPVKAKPKKAKKQLTPEQRLARAQMVGAAAAIGVGVAAEIWANEEQYKKAYKQYKNRPVKIPKNVWMNDMHIPSGITILDNLANQPGSSVGKEMVRRNG